MPNQQNQNNPVSHFSEIFSPQNFSMDSLSPAMKRKISQDTALIVRSTVLHNAVIKGQGIVAHSALTETALLASDVATLSHLNPEAQACFNRILHDFTISASERVTKFGGGI
ncbi:hypothetical protein [Candidatus Enterococcus clewellii]|uniref:Uncharacterized protein n=1 Tax=Candidatus Enterococcus clewellii TaxID=1834193 RepID=A0AAQ3XY36_9ENTE